MIKMTRSAAIAPGKTVEAVQFAKEITAYYAKVYGVAVQVLVPVGGNPMRIGWAVEYADLAALEAMMTKIATDTKYQEILVRGASLFVAGSVFDEIWRTV